MRQPGLTLVELLIVIAIIVILMGLLIVGLNRTMYDANFSACGASLRGITVGAQNYAFGHKRHYPVAKDRYPWPLMLAMSQPRPGGRPPSDLRPVIDGYIPLKMFVCPLSPFISLTYEDAGRASDSQAVWVQGTYPIWMGWDYKPQGQSPEAGMFRIGSRWTWGGDRFSTLVSDLDQVSEFGLEGAHPDHAGKLHSYRFQRGNGFITASGWTAQAPVERGAIDMNAGFDDGSVRSYQRLETLDERVRRTPRGAELSNVDEEWISVPLN